MKLFDLQSGQERDFLPPTTERAPQRTAAGELSEKLLEDYKRDRSNWATNALKDDEFRNGVQWTKEEEVALEEQNMMPAVTNVVHQAVEQAKAMLTSNRPKFSATAREDSDVKVAQLFAMILTYIWDTSIGTVQLKRIIDDYYVRGLGVAMAYVDPNGDMGKGEVCFRALDCFDVFVDPNSRDIYWQDAAHILVVTIVTGEQFQRMYPQYRRALEFAKPIVESHHPAGQAYGNEAQQIGTVPGAAQYAHKHFRLIDRYSRSTEVKYHVFNGNDGSEKFLTVDEYQAYLNEPMALVVGITGQQQIVTDQQAVANLQQTVSEIGPTFHLAANPTTGQPEPQAGQETVDPSVVPGSTVTVRFGTNANLLEMGVLVVKSVPTGGITRVLTLGDVELYNSPLPLEDYPIVPLMYLHNRNPFPVSPVRLVRPTQRMLNKVSSLIVAHASNSTNVKVLVPRGSLDKKDVEQKWSAVGPAMIEYDAELGAPTVVGPVPLPNELYRMEETLRHDIEQRLGIFALMQGDASAAPNTYKGTVALDEYGQRRIKGMKDDVEQFLNQLARVLVQLAQKTYTTQKTLRVTQPNDVPVEQTMNQPIFDDMQNVVGRMNDVTVGKYDVVVVSGSMLPSSRWAQFEYYMQMYEKGLIDQQEVLKKAEVFDVEQILARFSEMQALRSQVAALEGEVKKLSGDLQTAERESLHDRKRVELEKFKSDLKDITTNTKVQAIQKLADLKLAAQRNASTEGQTGSPVADQMAGELAPLTFEENDA